MGIHIQKLARARFAGILAIPRVGILEEDSFKISLIEALYFVDFISKIVPSTMVIEIQIKCSLLQLLEM